MTRLPNCPHSSRLKSFYVPFLTSYSLYMAILSHNYRKKTNPVLLFSLFITKLDLISRIYMMSSYWRTSHVPAFGSWEYCKDEDDLPPFTQCFETARHPPAGLSFPIYKTHSKDRDLYSAADLYQNAVIVVPRRHTQRGKGRYGYWKEKEDQSMDRRWVECGAVKFAPPPSVPRKTPKAVDEDLYKISPELLYPKPKKKRMSFLSCFFPNCHV